MSESVLELSSRILDSGQGEVGLPVGTMGKMEKVSDGIWFLQIFSNVVVFETSESLVLVDSGPLGMGERVRASVREVSEKPVSTVVYTHGHVDHVFGVAAFEAGQDAPVTVVAHEGVARRFDRYKLTAGYNERINRRQFRFSGLSWPKEFRYPDVVYSDEYVIDVGGLHLELRHAKGETDDHTWVWEPDRKVVCTGDLIIWCTPNAGNPQKVQRYPLEWAAALREMARLEPELLLPGHGLPVVGKDRVARVLGDTATLLERITDSTIELMNAGATLEEVLRRIEYPKELLDKPYLRPIYDDPEFIVRNVWRLYGGWYDGVAGTLKPPHLDDVARELSEAVGGARELADRASAALMRGESRLAGYLAELAARAAGDDRSVLSECSRIFVALAEAETSLMAKSIYLDAAEALR